MLLNPQHRLEEMQVAEPVIAGQVAESGAYAMNANFDSFAACAAMMCMAVVLLAEMACPAMNTAEPRPASKTVLTKMARTSSISVKAVGRKRRCVVVDGIILAVMAAVLRWSAGREGPAF